MVHPNLQSVSDCDKQHESGKLTPVHDDIPDAAVDTVDRRKHNVQSHHLGRPLDSEQTQTHTRENSKAILSTIDQVRENIAGIVITTYALQCAPNAREC